MKQSSAIAAAQRILDWINDHSDGECVELPIVDTLALLIRGLYVPEPQATVVRDRVEPGSLADLLQKAGDKNLEQNVLLERDIWRLIENGKVRDFKMQTSYKLNRDRKSEVDQSPPEPTTSIQKDC